MNETRSLSKIRVNAKIPLDTESPLWYCAALMTATQKEITALLHTADSHLRSAMVLAAGEEMPMVTDAIRESQWHLDEALAKVERYPKKNKKRA